MAENATIIGDVVMGDQCSVWFQAVVRGDVNFIRIGNKVNIQDGAILHGTYQKCGTTIGNNVSIGHRALVHGCTLHDNVLVGMGAIIMDRSRGGRKLPDCCRSRYFGKNRLPLRRRIRRRTGPAGEGDDAGIIQRRGAADRE
ncbi:MAG: gamma carbonic anhydrase family protein [Dermatophilaceae bacterium]